MTELFYKFPKPEALREAEWGEEGAVIRSRRRVSTASRLGLVLTSVSVNVLAVATHYSCEEIQTLHGKPDTDAIIGKLFYYPIPPYAFQGKINQFQVTLVHNVRLPRWLEYNASIKTLQGLPLEDEGRDFQIMASVPGDFCLQQTQTASITSTLHVLDRDDVKETSLIPSPSGVQRGSKFSTNVAEITIKAAAETLGFGNRLFLVHTLADYFHLDLS
ncbi:uncharacterized protein LOC122679964 [Cervus elaphus]|uniref:uncharacterized protein LOC122679964 n=1 Tax=Cervus elaphus TaxID=9860 RepID=UPI001CC2C649|nr:uncharacterized protein LOC122679964 [Cervus elaphus]